MNGRDRLIFAYDDATLDLNRVRALAPVVGVFKVGLHLFTSEGPAAPAAIRDAGGRVFLDLKLHDIPNTVETAAKAAARLGVAMFTVHAAGGRAMIAAAKAGALAGTPPGAVPPVVLAVTVLTSLTPEAWLEAGHRDPPYVAVPALAELAVAAGADGIVCSPLEIAGVRERVGEGPLLVVPGIRPAGAATDDQSRIATPETAVAAGADLLVVGRPIGAAPDPAAAARDIAAQIEHGLAARGRS